MRKQARGFTLIEILIVIANLGILIALLIPLLQEAIQKAKQKGTMQDINNLAKAITLYITEMGAAPTSPNGPVPSGHPFLSDLAPFQIRAIPLYDQWGSPLYIWTGASIAGNFGIEASDVGSDDYLIQSRGSDSLDEGFQYNRNNPEDYYVVRALTDFRKDLILWSGMWIRVPRAMAVGS